MSRMLSRTPVHEHSSLFYIGTSWKMNKTRAEAEQWIRAVLAAPEPPDSIHRFVIPPFTALDAAQRALQDSTVMLGAQNVHAADSGAFTGDISAGMLADLGCELVEIGHSERRVAYGETDADVHAKVHSVLAHGLRPLVCIGDNADERRLGVHVDSVLRQAGMALAGVDTTACERCLLAYEPVWAIGEGGKPATLAEVEEIHAALKTRLPGIPVLYGGSVDVVTAQLLAGSPWVDGLFIGRAALSAGGYCDVVKAALTSRFGITPD